MIQGRSGAIHGQGESSLIEANEVVHVARLHGWTPEKTLGQGAFGTVHLVHSPHTSQLLALKVVDLQRLTADPQRKEDNLDKQVRELNLHLELNHPNIVKLHTWFTSATSKNEFLFMVLDFCDGGHLLSHTRNRAVHGALLPQKVLVRWLTEALLALRYMHSHNILHRDLKPDNILLHGPASSLKLMDFGLARRLDSSLAHTRCGTPYYIPPEVASGVGVDGRGDVWALGVIFYELVAGFRPFDAEDMVSLFTIIMERDPPALSSSSSVPAIARIFTEYYEAAALYDEAFGDLIMSMLAKDMAVRPTAAQLLKHPLIIGHAQGSAVELHSLLKKQKASHMSVSLAIPVPSPPNAGEEDSELRLPELRSRGSPVEGGSSSVVSSPTQQTQGTAELPSGGSFGPQSCGAYTSCIGSVNSSPLSPSPSQHATPPIASAAVPTPQRRPTLRRPHSSLYLCGSDGLPRISSLVIQYNEGRKQLLTREYRNRLRIVRSAAESLGCIRQRQPLRFRDTSHSSSMDGGTEDSFARARRAGRLASAKDPISATSSLVDLSRGVENFIDVSHGMSICDESPPSTPRVSLQEQA